MASWVVSWHSVARLLSYSVLVSRLSVLFRQWTMEG